MGRSSLSSHSELWKRVCFNYRFIHIRRGISGKFNDEKLTIFLIAHHLFITLRRINLSIYVLVDEPEWKIRSACYPSNIVDWWIKNGIKWTSLSFSYGHVHFSQCAFCCSAFLLHALSLSHSSTFPPKKKQKFMLYFYSSSFFSYTQFLLMIEQFNFR